MLTSCPSLDLFFGGFWMFRFCEIERLYDAIGIGGVTKWISGNRRRAKAFLGAWGKDVCGLRASPSPGSLCVCV